MKQQNGHEERPELYRQLQGQFHMQPEQMRRLAGRLQIRPDAAGAPEAPAEQPVRIQAAKRPETMPAASHSADTAEEAAARRSRRFGGYGFAARVLPLAACLVLAVAGTLWMRSSFRQPDASMNSGVSDISDAVEEQTAPVQTVVTMSETSVDTTVSARTTRRSTATTAAAEPEESPQTASETQTETVQTEPEQNGGQPSDVTETPQTQHPAVQTTAAVTTAVQTTAAVTTALQTTAPMTETQCTSEPEIPDDVTVWMPECTGRAGETIEVGIVFGMDVSITGIQCDYVFLPQNGFAPTICSASSGIGGLAGKNEPAINFSGGEIWLAVAYGEGRMYPAGTRLLTLLVEIPEDAPAGTVWQLSNTQTLIFDRDGKKMPDSVHLGKITVTEN